MCKASSQTQKRAYRSLRLLRMDHVCCRASNVEKIYLGEPSHAGWTQGLMYDGLDGYGSFPDARMLASCHVQMSPSQMTQMQTEAAGCL